MGFCVFKFFPHKTFYNTEHCRKRMWIDSSYQIEKVLSRKIAIPVIVENYFDQRWKERTTSLATATTTTTTTTTLYLHRQCRLVGHSTSTLRRRNITPEKNYPSDVVGFLLATVNVVTVIMTSNVKFRLVVVPLLLFNVGQVFGLYSLQLHERLLFQWDLDFDRDILTAKVTYKPLPSEDGDPKGRG